MAVHQWQHIQHVSCCASVAVYLIIEDNAEDCCCGRFTPKASRLYRDYLKPLAYEDAKALAHDKPRLGQVLRGALGAAGCMMMCHRVHDVSLSA